MGVLMWEKPVQVMSKKEWAKIQADGAPPGTYTPNMSQEDALKWKAKLVGTKKGFPQVELRRNGVVVILSRKGYMYGGADLRQTPENLADYAEKKKRYDWDDEFDKVVHVSMNGSQAWSMKEYEEFQQALKEGWEFLDNLGKNT